MTPINQRRWQNFTANRRGFYSLIIFSILFFITLFAELIANDKPIILVHQGRIMFPVIEFYSEKDFGGDFDTQAQYKSSFMRRQISENGWAVWPLIEYNYQTINYDMTTPAPSAPSSENWLGTDDQGRDVLARLIYGFRISVLFGLSLTILSSAIGIALGAVQGYFGGWTDLVMQRVIEIWSGLPVLFILIIIASVFDPNFWLLLGIMLLFSWKSLVDVVRAEFLRTRNFEYVKAARILGVSEFMIIRRHVLPNAFTASLTYMPFVLNASITTLTSLDFLSLGLPPGSPSLGELLAQGKNNITAPWLGITGFFSLAIMLSLLIFIGEAVRDALNPQKVFS